MIVVASWKWQANEQITNLKILLPCPTANLKNADELKTTTDGMGPLPLGAKLFTADAKSMHANMDATHVLSASEDVIDSSACLLPTQCP